MFIFEHRLLSTAFSNGFYLVNKAIKICCEQLRQLCSTSLAASSQPLPSSGHLDTLKGLQIHLLFLETGHVIHITTLHLKSKFIWTILNCTILFLNICNQNFLFFQIKQLNKQLFDIPSTGCTKGNSLNWNVHFGFVYKQPASVLWHWDISSFQGD